MEKGIPKKDGSGRGIRLNKGRGGCPPERQERIGKGITIPREFRIEQAMEDLEDIW